MPRPKLQQRYFAASDGKRTGFWTAPYLFKSAQFTDGPIEIHKVKLPHGAVWFSGQEPDPSVYKYRAFEITKNIYDCLYAVRAAQIDADPTRSKNWRRGGMIMAESWVWKRMLNPLDVSLVMSHMGDTANGEADMEYTVEQLTSQGDWTILGSDRTSASAQAHMWSYRRLFPTTAIRVVERPTGRLIVCEGGAAA